MAFCSPNRPPPPEPSPARGGGANGSSFGASRIHFAPSPFAREARPTSSSRGARISPSPARGGGPGWGRRLLPRTDAQHGIVR